MNGTPIATLREKHPELCFVGKDRASVVRLQHDFFFGVCRHCGQNWQPRKEETEAPQNQMPRA